MTAWTDLAVRANLSSTEGQVPAGGGQCACPDIIPTQQAPQDPTAAYATSAVWGTDFGGDVTQGLPTSFFVRGHNFASGAQSVPVYLYKAPNAAINWPVDWMTDDNKLYPDPKHPNVDHVTLSAQNAGDLVVAEQPFTWPNPSPPPSPSDHYCLFVLLDTPNTPNPLLHPPTPPPTDPYTSMGDLVNNYLNIGWRNIALQSNGSPTFTRSLPLHLPTPPAGQNALQVTIGVDDSMLGGAVSLSCPQASVFTPPLQFAQKTLTESGQVAGVVSTLPAQPPPDITLNISYYQQDAKPVLGDDLHSYYTYVPPKGSDMLATYVDAGTATKLLEEWADVGDGWGVTLGSMHYRFADIPS